MCCLVLACPSTPVMYCLPRRFFESLYAALAAVLSEAFERLDRKVMLEQELGRLFRCVGWRGRKGGGGIHWAVRRGEGLATECIVGLLVVSTG